MISGNNKKIESRNGKGRRNVKNKPARASRAQKKRDAAVSAMLFEKITFPKIADQQLGTRETIVGRELMNVSARRPAKESYKPMYTKRSSPQFSKAQQPEPSVRITFLGGLNEIGKNITLFEYEDDMFLLDCGMAFPDGDMLGVDLVIPDFTYLERNKDKLRGVVLTHGHEDHIGALPYFLRRINVPVYGTALTLGLVGSKLKEHNLQSRAKLNVVKAGQRIKLGKFTIEFIHVNHSIPDSVGLAIHTGAGTIVHTGDFKIDCTPTTGGMIDLSRFAELGKQGVLALMADSTNAERPGYTMTEQKVGHTFDMLFREAEDSRIIIATFASNLGRIRQILDTAQKYGRKVAFSGRSMINNMTIASELGYIDVPDGLIIDIDMLGHYTKDQIVLITTGSQGETMSALSRMAYSDHRKVEVGPEDYIIISANPIPGNEKSVSTVVNELMKHGCKIASESMYEVHVSGHACQEELKIIQGLTKPKYFIPVHGEQKHLRKHAELAEFLGMDKKHIYIGDIGKTIEVCDDYMREVASVPAGKVFVDGLGVGDVGSIVLRDRKHLGQDGLIIIVASLDVYDGHVITGPDIVSRGFVYVRESETLLDEVRQLALGILEDCAEKNIHEWGVIKNRLREEISKLISQRTRRSPMILPILQEV